MSKKTKGRLTRDGATVRRVQVMLDDVTIERAKELGDGNLSMGIRQAVAILPSDTEKDERGTCGRCDREYGARFEEPR